jgi:hypothetical protein
LREDHGLRVFENKMLRKIYGPKRDGRERNGKDYMKRSCMTCTHPILLG